MTNEEKAKEIARECVYCSADAENGALKMAEWKDQQFKEYLEKKMAEYEARRDDTNMWSEQWAVFHALTCTMHKIIKELFKEE